MATAPASHPPSGGEPHRATVAAGFVTGMVAGLRARGVDPRPLVAAAGIAPDILSGREARAPIAAYAALYNAVVRALGDEGFGLFSAPLRPGTFEFLCRGVVSSATLGEALERAARFLAIVLPDLEIRIVRGAGEARIEIGERRRLRPRAGHPARVFAFEWLLRLLHGLSCWLAGRGLTLDEVRFPYPRPPHAADYALVYTEHSSFDAPRLVAAFDARLLELPVRRDASDLASFLDGAPGKISMLYRRDREMARAVREALACSLDGGPGFDALARSLNLSPRTLHRRLAHEGTSFRALKASLRRERALQRLEKSRSSVAEIAAELGYSEPSAFFRAFRGWTGASPSAHRKRSRAGR
jgi:AraC-like DNA-binding protein